MFRNPRKTRLPLTALVLLAVAPGAAGAPGGPENVLLIVNSSSSASADIGAYYARRRGIPRRNVCLIRSTAGEEISRAVFEEQVLNPVRACLVSRSLQEEVLYIVTTLGVPLKVAGTGGPDGTEASVDSELTLLYSELKGEAHPLAGRMTNPLFGRPGYPFSHPLFPIYLVTRLAAYDVATVKGMIDRGLAARNVGRVVLDARRGSEETGDNWLRSATAALPSDRVVWDESTQPTYNVRDVIGFASWGSNDPHRTKRHTGFGWLPGAIVTEYVSTDGRTFRRPPDNWAPSADWTDQPARFEKSPQSLAADYLGEGATGASGHVYEPYLQFTPRPDLLFPAYLAGRNLAESFYLAIPALSWQNIVLGDPLCTLAGATPAHLRK